MTAELIHNPSLEKMPKSADVVIIGGGPAGTAAAWGLEQQQPGIKTVLVEQEEDLGRGASMASLENFRTCWPWPHESLIEMMDLSFKVFTHPDDYLGIGASQALNIKQHGYLYVAFNEQQAKGLQKDVVNLNQQGLNHIEYLNQTEVAYRYPFLGDCVVAAKFDSHAGWLNSNNLIRRYAKASGKAKFLTGVTDSQILVRGEKIVGVKTANGVINTEKVIIAAGAGSRQVGRTAGIEIPIIVTPKESFITSFRDKFLPENAPFIIGPNPYPYVRPESFGAIFGWSYKRNSMIDPVWPVEKMKDSRFPPVVLDLLARQFKQKNDGFSDLRYRKGLKHQAGYFVTREYSSSENNSLNHESEYAIIDAWPEIQGLFLSVAHGGYGIMTSPASGMIIASIVLGQKIKSIFTKFNLSIHN